MIQDDRPTPSPAKSTEYGVPAGHPGLPSDWPVRAAWLFAGVVLPFFCLLISYPAGPTWQSGKLNAYAQLLLSHKSSMAQYPFLLYSMICMVLVVLQPARFSNRTLVRLGIFTGVLLAAEHWLVFQFACSDLTDIALSVLLSAVAVFVPWLLTWLFGLLVQKFGKEPVLVIVSLGGFLIVIFYFPLAVIIVLWCSTPWALASYLAVSIHLVRGDGRTSFRFSLAQLLIAFAWLSAHLGAWRISFLVMLREYASLPTSPSGGCFGCTAVAKGHFRVVRSEEYVGQAEPLSVSTTNCGASRRLN